jgi:hypothetical protein
VTGERLLAAAIACACVASCDQKDDVAASQGTAVQSEHARPSANCAARPAEFQNWDEHARRLPKPVASPVKNVIRVDRSGAIGWNGAELQSQHGPFPLVEDYLGVVSKMEPQPLTFLDFEVGASCSSIERVRTLMNTHLRCSVGKTCFQGSGPS